MIKPTIPPAAVQQDLFSFSQPVAIPQGDGTFLLKPGKPLVWMTVKQFALAVGDISEDTIYRYIGSDYLPIRSPLDPTVEFVRRLGGTRLRISAAALSHFVNHGTATLRQ